MSGRLSDRCTRPAGSAAGFVGDWEAGERSFERFEREIARRRSVSASRWRLAGGLYVARRRAGGLDRAGWAPAGGLSVA
jgi:hypothetical protein